MADIIPYFFIIQQGLKKIDFSSDVIKCILCNGSYNESLLNDYQTYADVSAFELSTGGGYVQGGVVVSGTSITSDAVNNRTLYKCSDIYISATTGNIGPARYAVMYDSTGENTLVYIFDFGENKTIIYGTSLIIKVDPVAFMVAKQKPN